MSKREVLEITIMDNMIVKPESIFESKVVKYGNGAMIKAYKKFIGKNAIIIIKKE